MNLNALTPPGTVLESFRQLKEAGVAGDPGPALGEIVRFIDEAAWESKRIQICVEALEDKELAGMLHEALAATSRILMRVYGGDAAADAAPGTDSDHGSFAAAAARAPR